MNSQSLNLSAPIGPEAAAKSLQREINRSRIAAFVATVQLILFLAHWFIYRTWEFFEGPRVHIAPVQILLLVLSLSFVSATLLSHRYNNLVVRLYYKIAATWLGFLNCFVLGACFSWVAYLLPTVVGFQVSRSALGTTGWELALVLAVYGLLRAQRVRVKRITLKIPNLPGAWRGRLAAQVTDTHLGHVHGRSFLRRIVRLLQQVAPDIVFITGDLYDGSRVGAKELIEPWQELTPVFGTYFVTGNHEEFGDPKQYLDAIRGAGIRVLENEKEAVEGMQIIGVRYRDASSPSRLESIVKREFDPGEPCILLTHAPFGVRVAAQSGISLQLSGHTHAGQVFPFTYFTRIVFQEYTYGLRRLGDLFVYTSSGAGTWGPPMRLGAPPEIVVFEFV